MSPSPLSHVPESQVPTPTSQCPHHLVPVSVLYTAATQRKAVMGVKGHSIFAKLLYPFDLIRSFAIDWMYCVCLGVVKYIMQLQMSDGNRDKPFYLGAKKASISRQLLSIKPPDIVGRSPRSLEDLKHWKATELKNWLLQYSVAGLRNKLNALYIFQ